MPKPADGRRRGEAPDPNLRIGDTERNQVAEALSQHYSAGRIDDNELKERLDRAMSAKTGNDLKGLMTDLPPLDPTGAAQPPAPSHPRRRLTGLWVVLGAIFVLSLLAHGPLWWPWWMAVRVPWIIVALIAFVLWRRSRHRRWHSEPS